METTNSNIPALRFPEFTGKWEHIRLGEVSSDISYGMNSAAIDFDGKHKYLRITDIDENTREFTPSPLSSPDGIISEKYRLKNGDMVFARTGASVGKSYLYKEKDGELYYAGFLIKFSITKAVPHFVYSQTFRGEYNKWVQKMSMRSGQPGINAEEYKTLKISYPTIAEQQKIASFLTAVDNKLQQLQKKKALLEQYKKGVMQQIFTQQLRFKDDEGKEYPEWENTELKDAVEFWDNKRKPIKESDRGLIKGSYPYYGASGIIDYVNDYIFDDDLILLGEDGANIITRSSPLAFKVGGKIWVNNHAHVLKPKKIVNISYLVEFLESLKYDKYNSGTAQPKLNQEACAGIPIVLPSKAEQDKIAMFFDGIINKITLIKTEITQTQNFKRGLLQQLFV